jgi:hypothetical protein
LRGRWLIVLLALAAAAAFALSVQSGRWWSLAGDTSIGPFGSKACFEGQCRDVVIDGTDRWLRTGIATGASGLLSMFILTIVAAGVASKRVPKLAAKSALASVVTSLTTGALFMTQRPSIHGIESERGLFLFAIAIGLGIATTIIVLAAKPVPSTTT